MEIEGIRVQSFSVGRVRLKVEEIKKSPDFAASVQERIGALPGIKKVETNQLTGSVLVTYNERQLASAESREALKKALSDLFPDKNLERLHEMVQSIIS